MDALGMDASYVVDRLDHTELRVPFAWSGHKRQARSKGAPFTRGLILISLILILRLILVRRRIRFLRDICYLCYRARGLCRMR